MSIHRATSSDERTPCQDRAAKTLNLQAATLRSRAEVQRTLDISYSYARAWTYLEKLYGIRVRLAHEEAGTWMLLQNLLAATHAQLRSPLQCPVLVWHASPAALPFSSWVHMHTKSRPSLIERQAHFRRSTAAYTALTRSKEEVQWHLQYTHNFNFSSSIRVLASSFESLKEEKTD